jgi:type II secretion system protein C
MLALLLALSAMPPDLKAVGLVTSSHKERSVAVLSSGGRTRVVGVGEMAFGGRVLEIGATTVALDFDGRRAEIPLAAAVHPDPAFSTSAVETPPPVAEAGPATLNLPRSEMDRRLGVELNRILAETALRPVTDGDSVQGLVLSRVAEGTLLTDAGLRAGDVLTEINGVPIDSLATLIGLYGRLQTETHVQATVMRNGAPVSLALQLK